MSSKASLRLVSISSICKVRSPGASMMSPPCGRGIMRRATVVWRPLSSDARTSPVASASVPKSALTNDDLPTPLSPSSRPVVNREKTPRSLSMDAASSTETTNRGVSGATALMRSQLASIVSSFTRSPFVSTNTGVASQPETATIWRTSRSSSTPMPVREWQMSTMSTFAAST